MVYTLMYFTNQELKELFQLESTTESITQRQLQDLHHEQRCLDPKLEEHLAYLHTLPMFGVSDHDLMFSQDPDDIDADIMEDHRDVIKNKVAEAQNRVELEAQRFTGSEVPEQRWGDFNIEPKPYEPRAKEVEPHFEIEGLYDRLDSLKVEDDDVIEGIFNKSKISIPSDSDEDIKPKIGNIPTTSTNQPTTSTNQPIHILDSEDEENNPMNQPVSPNEILADDSPMKANEKDDNRIQMETLEVGESFLEESGFAMDTTDQNSKLEQETSTIPSHEQGLLDADISCIANDQIQKSNFMEETSGISSNGDNTTISPGKENDMENRVVSHEVSPKKGNVADSIKEGSAAANHVGIETSTQNQEQDGFEKEGEPEYPEFNDNFIQDTAVCEELLQPFSSTESSRAPTPALQSDLPNLDLNLSSRPETPADGDIIRESIENSRANSPSREDERVANDEIIPSSDETAILPKDNEEETVRLDELRPENENENTSLNQHISPGNDLSLMSEEGDLKLSLSDSEEESFIEKQHEPKYVGSDDETDIEMSDDDRHQISEQNGDASSLMEDESFQRKRKNEKKSRARLLSDSGDSEPANGETILSEGERSDDSDATDLDDFIDDDEEDGRRRKDSLASFLQEEVIDDFDSSWNGSESRKTKLKRRSTALPQRKLIESDDESENENVSSQYRQPDTIESSDENEENAGMSLALSFQSGSEEELC